MIVATGSYARTIPGYEIDGDRIVTSDHALDWPAQPGRVAIIGGGVIGCEFASLLADLGTEVHVIELLPQIIPGGDADAVKLLEREMTRRGRQVPPRQVGRGAPARAVEHRGALSEVNRSRSTSFSWRSDGDRAPRTSGSRPWKGSRSSGVSSRRT